MWDALPATPLGTLTWRKLLAMVTLFLVTVFAYMFATTPLAHAADVSWQGSNLSYQNNTYNGPSKATNGDGRDLPDGTTYYTYMEPQVPFVPQKVHVIYFPPGTDPAKATTAQYVTYEMGPGGGLTNKSSTQSVSVDASKAPGTSGNNPAPGSSTTTGGSCQVDGNMGWIICPLTNTIAKGMDWVFDVMANFLAVRPLETTSTGVMMNLWNVMRNFANVAFVIAFVIIIYSQLTSIGISNYGIKKILPRLIIAAVLVNISYWLCAVAIDLSNIAGYALQALFEGMRNDILHGTNINGWKLVDWQTVATFVLSGGAATIGAAVAWTALSAKLAAFSVPGVALLLLPVLLSVFLVVLVVLFILAARQAIITLLVILAPLAFVAYILPNTAKLFERWRELFTTMLVFFPLFSLAFGGAQLAGLAIIHNSTSIAMVIFGLAVQIAPLAITPLILKLSGGLLTRVAGVINNPKRGIVDRTRNWANDRLDARRAAEMQKTRAMANAGTLKRRSVMRRTALHHDNERRMREGLKAVNEDEANVLFEASHQGHTLARAQRFAQQNKGIVENSTNAQLQQEVNLPNSDLHANNVRLEQAKLMLENATLATDADIKEYKSGEARPVDPELRGLANSMRDITVENAAQTQRGQSAANMQQKLIAEQFTAEGLAGDALRRQMNLLNTAAGVDPNGVVRAKANADAALEKIEKEALDNTLQLLNTEARKQGLTIKQLSNSIVKDEISSKGSSGRLKQEIDAALEYVATDGNISMLRLARQSANIDQDYLNKVLARNSGTMKQKGGFDLQANFGLARASDQKMNISIASTLGEISAKNIKDVKAGFWSDIAGTGENTKFRIDNIMHDVRIGLASSDTKTVEAAQDAMNGILKTYANITDAMRDTQTWNEIGDKRDQTIAIHQALHSVIGDGRMEVDYDKLEKPSFPGMPPTGSGTTT